MFPWFKKRKTSASVAKERLKIAIMTDRVGGEELPYMEDLKRDIIAVVRKYREVSNIDIQKIRSSEGEAIAIEVELID